MARNRKVGRGHCVWPGCPESGAYFTGRTVGLEKKWGYACEVHERVIASENLDRYQEEALFTGLRPSWQTALRNIA